MNKDFKLRPNAPGIMSPLQYPGGKTKAINTIINMFPYDMTHLCSPFIGGGSIELAVAAKFGVTVHAYDGFKQLVQFWQCALSNPKELAEKAWQHNPMSSAEFIAMKKGFPSLETDMDVAVAFYVLNRTSYSGITLSGGGIAGMSTGHRSFNKSTLKKLANLKVDRFTVEHADFKDSIPKHPDSFLYCDPPYAIKRNLYGIQGSYHKNFDHDGLASILKTRDNWILSYNDCDKIRDLYSGYDIQTPKWIYGMNRPKWSKEVLIRPTTHY